MTSAAPPPASRIDWNPILWFGALILACYAPVLYFLGHDWVTDADMGHGFFVPIVAGYIAWQRREELFAIKPKPNLWGLLLVVMGACQMIVATLGVELFLARSAFVITLIGVVWLMGGTRILKILAFPLFLLFFMIPIPAIIYNRITFPLQLIASKLAENALELLNVPVGRDGNVLELPSGNLSVVEACSGIRSLLSLTFLSLIYGYFFEKKTWIRVFLFLSTIPIAIIANGSRVTFTGLVAQIKPELAEGLFHESTGWVIFIVAMMILILLHRLLIRTLSFIEKRRVHA